MANTGLAQIESIDRDWLTAAQVAQAMQWDANLIRWQAHLEPKALGFPVIVIGTRVKIPKIPFLKFMRSELQ